TEIPVWSRTQTRDFCLPRGLRPSYSSSCQRDTDRNTGTESEDRARKVQALPVPQKDPARTAPRGRSSNGRGADADAINDRLATAPNAKTLRASERTGSQRRG